MALSTPEKEAYLKERTEGYMEILRQSPGFQCACCNMTRYNAKDEAAGVWTYRTKDPTLRRQMRTPRGIKVAQYVLCKECIDTFEPKVIYQKVTAFLATQGLFDPDNDPDRPKEKPKDVSTQQRT